MRPKSINVGVHKHPNIVADSDNIIKMLRSLMCCYTGGHQRLRRTSIVWEDEDYLLPGGDVEWDGHSKSFVARKHTAETTGSYVPPSIPAVNLEALPTIEEFRLLRTVGRGAFGKVMLTVHNPTRTLYAIKVIPKAKLTKQKQIRQIVTEMQILKKIRHPFCVTLQYAFQNGDFLFYVFEFASGGMLFYHLKEETRFNESRARFYLGEIILALEYLHGFGIVFRDLKPENCMLSAIGHIIITDFGSAKKLADGEKTSTLAGTPQYMAPEVLKGELYSYSADWWSCGILLYEMLVGKTPFQSYDRVELYRAVLRGDFKVPFFISPRARSLLYRLIERDRELRLGCVDDTTPGQSAAEIKSHPFFSQIPLDPDEEAQYVTEEAERQRHQQALDRALSSGAGNIVRRLSSSAARFSGSFSLQGTPCEWDWEMLAGREVTPPFTPKLTHPTDCSYFDPIITSLPPTLNDLATTGTDNYIEGFDYIASTSIESVETLQEGSGSSQRDANESLPHTTVLAEVHNT